ncbi:MAG: proton-conducting transporter membrane subunit [Clostridiales bacterium]|nr:proton-conducting transporter membrane subunit [Clostridiales bacterium]
MEGNIMLLFLTIWPMIGAILSYVIGRKNKNLRDYFAEFVTIVEFVTLLVLCVQVVGGKEAEFVLHDFCARGLYLKADGFRAVYALIAGFMWMMTTLFSKQYFAHYRNRNRYYLFMLLTLGATVGVFLSADLFTTFIFFEMMSFTSYVWVAHDEEKASLRAAETYLAVAVIGGMIMLIGLFLLNFKAGTLNMDQLLAACAAVEDKTLIYVAGGCLLFGFGAKAGMFPLHIWLPKAHPVAPAPASALLSGILTKTGVFGILVISCQMFLHDAAWGKLILMLGVVTMFGGAVLALFSIDLKRTLACSSMSQIGFILVGVGMQGILGEHNALAARGTVLHMVNHSLIKLVLFMAAGVVFMNLHKLDLNAIRGFGRKKKALMFSFLMGTLGIGGIPLWNGYVSKTLLHESIVEYAEMIEGTADASTYVAVEWIFLITGGLTVAYMLKLFICLFIEKNADQAKMEASDKNYMNRKSMFALVTSSIVLPILGFLPGMTMDKIADATSEFMHAHHPEHAVHYFNFTNLKGGLISIAIGVIIYFGFVRTALMRKDETGTKVYVNIWPKWFDLENGIYRPLIQHLIPFVLAVICRVFDKLFDCIVYLIAKFILGPVKTRKQITVGTRFTYVLGTIMDDIVKFLNKTITKKRPIKRSFVEYFAVGQTEVSRTSKLVTRSVSFGLLMFCVGLLMTLVYLLMVSV